MGIFFIMIGLCMNNIYLMICGPGESGKDEVAGMLQTLLPQIGYKKPTSWYAIDPFFAEVEQGLWTTEALRNQGHCELDAIGLYPGQFKTKTEFYEARRIYRWIWGHWVGYYNNTSPDKIRLYRDAIEAGERVFVGLRKVVEYDSFRNHYPTFSIWIQHDCVKPDCTQQYGSEKCDFIIQNNGTVVELRQKVKLLVDFMRGELFKDLRTRIGNILDGIKC